MYEAVLRKPGGGKVVPQEVGNLYATYCKKNMKVSSAKSMDELCAPLVKKIEQKMRWVPPEVSVTPALACASIDKLKEQFPEHVAVAELQLKSQGVEEAKQQQLLGKAKELKTKLSNTLKTVLGKWGKELVQELGVRFREQIDEALGPDFGPTPKEAMISQMEEATSLSSRGMETKLLQKLEEAVGAWVALAKREAKAKPEL